MKKVLLSILLSFSLLFTIVNAQSFTFTSPMNVGSTDSTTGGQVTKLQETLNRLGLLNVSPTGYFGQLTKAAVMKFQAMQGFEQVGNVGPLTRKALSELSGSSYNPNTSYTGNNTNTNYSGSLDNAIPSSASAKPAINNISISFTSLDETVVLNIPYNSILNLPNLSPRSKFPGYTFSGWYTNTSYTSTYQKTPIVSPVHFYAKWIKSCQGGDTVVFPIDCDISKTTQNQSEAQTKQCLVNGISVTVSSSLDCSKLTNQTSTSTNKTSTSTSQTPSGNNKTSLPQEIYNYYVDVLNWGDVKECSYKGMNWDKTLISPNGPYSASVFKIPNDIIYIPKVFDCPIVKNFNDPTESEYRRVSGSYISFHVDAKFRPEIPSKLFDQGRTNYSDKDTKIWVDSIGAIVGPCLFGPYLFQNVRPYTPDGKCPKPDNSNNWLLDTDIINQNKNSNIGGQLVKWLMAPSLVINNEDSADKYYPVPKVAIPQALTFDENGNIIDGPWSNAQEYINKSGGLDGMGYTQIAKKTLITIHSPYIQYYINAIVPLDNQKIKLSNYVTKTLFGYKFDGIYTDFYYTNEYEGYDKSLPNTLSVKDSYAASFNGSGYPIFDLYAKWTKKCDDGKTVVWPDNCFKSYENNVYDRLIVFGLNAVNSHIGEVITLLPSKTISFSSINRGVPDYILEGMYADKAYTQYIDTDRGLTVRTLYAKWIQNCKDGTKAIYPKKCTTISGGNIDNNTQISQEITFKNDGSSRIIKRNSNPDFTLKVLVPPTTPFFIQENGAINGRVWVFEKRFTEDPRISNINQKGVGVVFDYVISQFAGGKTFEPGGAPNDPFGAGLEEAVYIRGNPWFNLRINSNIPNGIYIARICKETRSLACSDWSESDPFEIRDN